MEHISKVIERKLAYLNLQLAEKIKLSVFPDKVLYKAKDQFEQTESKKSTLSDPFSRIYAMCLHYSEKLNMPADFGKEARLLKQYDGVTPVVHLKKTAAPSNTTGAQLAADESKNINELFQEPAPKKKYKWQSQRSATTFNQGERYFKHGQWHAYPDQAINENSNPSQPKPCTPSCGACKQEKKINRDNIVPRDELKKAIASGKMNMKGLSYLRELFLGKPDLLELIDKAIADHRKAIDMVGLPKEPQHDDVGMSNKASNLDEVESDELEPSNESIEQKTFVTSHSRSSGNLMF